MKKQKTTLAYRRLQEIRTLRNLLSGARMRDADKLRRLRAVATSHISLMEKLGIRVQRGVSGEAGLVGHEERPVQKFKDLEEARKWVMSNLINL